MSFAALLCDAKGGRQDRSALPDTFLAFPAADDLKHSLEVKPDACTSLNSQGPMFARRLMEARAQTCMVCMERKEHTLIPPHRHQKPSTSGDEALTSHRFCTDCWSAFLRHGFNNKIVGNRKRLEVKLVCPVCRDDLEVPDVWRLRLGLQYHQYVGFRSPGAPSATVAGASSAAAAADVPARVSLRASLAQHLRRRCASLAAAGRRRSDAGDTFSADSGRWWAQRRTARARSVPGTSREE
eukprot:TRINITY_DN15173_c0_g1_i1.p1 TRINITY_DN15173_c0_g1~~TRINITY_DN15173_c0_g1_i1.p1  ORF type:complete len:240 (+),score=46.45 TRINITY_DN15173_c0_g1_i1:63-782(+)